MTTATAIASPESPEQHLVLHGVSWGFYERVLEEIVDRSIRVTYSDGSMEIMSISPKHESPGRVISRLITVLSIERMIPTADFGSTTFRREDLSKGLEPDDCFYVGENEARVRGMQEFDPLIHPAPDLAIEVDVSRRSIPRQPIYAALGVSELWRFDANNRLVILRLRKDGEYRMAKSSRLFPFLPMDQFHGFVLRMLTEEQTAIMIEFRDWIRTLP